MESRGGSLNLDYLEELKTFFDAQKPRAVWHPATNTTHYHATSVTPGLTGDELRAAEEAFDCPFPPDFRSLLSAFVVVGEGWPDWRDPVGQRKRVADRIRDTAEFDITHGNFWHPDWGAKPDPENEALQVASSWLRRGPGLLPIYIHRYLPAEPCEAGNPVISMYQFIDSIYYGNDLADYFHQEFGAPRPAWARSYPKRVPFWSSVVEVDA